MVSRIMKAHTVNYALLTSADCDDTIKHRLFQNKERFCLPLGSVRRRGAEHLPVDIRLPDGARCSATLAAAGQGHG